MYRYKYINTLYLIFYEKKRCKNEDLPIWSVIRRQFSNWLQNCVDINIFAFWMRFYCQLMQHHCEIFLYNHSDDKQWFSITKKTAREIVNCNVNIVIIDEDSEQQEEFQLKCLKSELKSLKDDIYSRCLKKALVFLLWFISTQVCRYLNNRL